MWIKKVCSKRIHKDDSKLEFNDDDNKDMTIASPPDWLAETPLPSKTKDLSKNSCMNPLCRKRLTKREHITATGFEYSYCPKCRADQTRRTKHKQFHETIKWYFEEVEKRPLLQKLVSKGFTGLGKFSEPANHSPNSFIYAHFLFFHKSRYKEIAEILTDIYINPWEAKEKEISTTLSSIAHFKPKTREPLPTPTPNDMSFARKIHHVLTNTKECRTCCTILPTYFVPKAIPEDNKPETYIASSRRKHRAKPKVLLDSRPERPATADEIAVILNMLLETNTKRIHQSFIQPAFFARSYPSKDGWSLDCVDCKKMQVISNRKRELFTS